jgi:Holliday junction resolvasome RuvABC ATP-dependent DNA helicase subunit/Holliday junction resolvase-like predicted endonuclease
MSRTIPIEKNILVVVPESYSPSKKGAFFEKLCADILKKQSYEISNIEIRKTGMEIDIQANHTPSSKTVYVECKFFNSKKVDAGIVDLCFAQATRARIDRIALFSTADLGKDAQGAYETYRRMNDCDYSFYGKKEILDALEVSGKVESYESLNLDERITHATLLVHPELPFTWLFQEMNDGITNRILAFNSTRKLDCNRIRTILDTHNIFENIPISILSDDLETDDRPAINVEREVVSGIVIADDIMDPKPCKPSDFVGRDTIQKDIWDFLESVNEQNTDTRLMSLIGASGNGKSSLVACLAERFRNQKWKNRYYLYPVDVRSARGARFVAETVVKSFNSAIEDGFIEFEDDFKVENIEDLTSGKSFTECSNYLKEHGKVLILFFDQFEEVFMKEELYGLFRAFERFAIDVSSEKLNFVVGFSWRSGITLGEENPAYSMWSRLKDRRIDKKLDIFTIKDSSKLIASYEKSIGIKLNKTLRTRVIQQSQGFPWLLKKLCMHIFKKIRNKVSQEELLITQLQIKSLFDEDLERPDREVACLRYVANNSPIDHYQTTKEFSQSTVYNLISDRLIIKTGEKISVYWDVFRDYLITDEAPIIPWSYMPAASVKMAVSIYKIIVENGKIDLEQLLELVDYKKGTLTNIIMDLQSFSLVEKESNGCFSPINNTEKPEDIIRAHLKGHIIYLNLLSIAGGTGKVVVTTDGYIQALNSVYSNERGDTPKGYSAKILNWLLFSGLISKIPSGLVVYSNSEFSPEYGMLGTKSYLFFGGTSPSKSLELIELLKSERFVSLSTQNELKMRNAVIDLVSLGICKRQEDSSVIFTKNIDVALSTNEILAQALLKSNTVTLVREINDSKPDDREEMARKLRNSLGKAWKDATCKRYLNGLLKYLEFLDAHNKALQRTSR